MAEQNEGTAVKKEHELQPGAPDYVPQAGSDQQAGRAPEHLAGGPQNEPRKDDPAEGRRDVG